MLELHYGPGACSFVPHVALEAIKAATGEDFVPRPVKLHKGEQRTPEYLAINPNAQVPTLVVDGKPLSQIVAICDYLDRRFPQVGLLPTESWARAQAMSQFLWMNNTVHTTFTHVFMPDKFCDGEATMAELKRFNAALYRTQLERIQGWIAAANPTGSASACRSTTPTRSRCCAGAASRASTPIRCRLTRPTSIVSPRTRRSPAAIARRIKLSTFRKT